MYKLTDGTELTAEIKKAFKENETQAYITYDNKTLTYDDYLINVSMNEERFVPDEGFIGQAVEREITIKLNNEDNQFNLENKEVEYYQGVKLKNGVIKYINFGKFIVLEPENNDTKETTEFIARDYMKKFNIPYVHTLGTNYTYLQLVQSLCQQAGVELGSTSFRNSNKIIASNPFINNEQCRFVLKQVAKIAFSVAYIGQDNKLYIGFENKTTVDESITTDEYIELEDNEQTKPITVVTLRSSEVPAEGYSIKDNELINSSANYNMVNVIDTQKTIGELNVIPNNGKLTINGSVLTSADVEISNPNNYIRLKAGKSYSVIAYTEGYGQTGSIIEFNNNTTSVLNDLIITNSDYNIMNITPEEDIIIDKIDLEVYPTIKNYTLELMIVEGTYTAENAPEFIKFEKLGEHELVIEEDYFAYSEELRIDLIQAASALFGLTYSPIKVSLLGSVYLGFNDVIEVTNLKGEKFKTYCFNLNSEYKGTLYNDIESPALTNVEQEYEYEEEVDLARRRTFIEIDKANQKITASVERIDENEEAITLLELTADGLQTQVSQKIGANEVISTINQSAEKILIKANRISIESSYFTLAENGIITATSGTIGGINITDTGLFWSGKASTDGFGLWKINTHTQGDNSIIFHAGSNNQNIGNAGVRILQNGTTYMKNLIVESSFVNVSEGNTGGGINILGNLPFIDFHANNATNFTTRLIDYGSRFLIASDYDISLVNRTNQIYRNLYLSRLFMDGDNVLVWQSEGNMLLSSITGVSVVNQNNSAFNRINASEFCFGASPITMRFSTTNNIRYIGFRANNGIRAVNEDGSAYTTVNASDFVRNSSKRYKENIQDMSEDVQEKLMELRPVTFDYKKDSMMTGKNVGGLIAEEAEKVIEELVTYTNIDGEKQADGIDYSKLVPYLLKGYQILFNKVKAIEENLDNK